MVWRAGVGFEEMDVWVAARKRWPANLGARAIVIERGGAFEMWCERMDMRLG